MSLAPPRAPHFFYCVQILISMTVFTELCLICQSLKNQFTNFKDFILVESLHRSVFCIKFDGFVISLPLPIGFFSRRNHCCISTTAKTTTTNRALLHLSPHWNYKKVKLPAVVLDERFKQLNISQVSISGKENAIEPRTSTITVVSIPFTLIAKYTAASTLS